MRKFLILIAALFISQGCQLGANAGNFPVAHRVNGATLRIVTKSQRFDGELLEVRDNGIVVSRKDGQVVLVPWLVTQNVSAPGLGRDFSYGFLMPPSRSTIPNLVKVSHFPQGMSPEIEARLLASRGQKEIVVIQ